MPFAEGSVILGGARTPMGKLQGVLAPFEAVELGGVAIKGALERSGWAPEDIDYVIMGQVILAGAGQNPARQAAWAGGIGMTTPALTVNKVCLSGINAIALADQGIRAGEFRSVVAGGMESMSRAPHLLRESRSGIKFGSWPLEDSLIRDGLSCTFDGCSMGEATEQYNERYEISRIDQDSVAASSHQRAAAAQAAGFFDEEIVSVSSEGRSKAPVVVSVDEGVRSATTVESLARLNPAIHPEGTITAGNASQISDGAAALVVVSPAIADEHAVKPLASLGAHGAVAGPDASLHEQPAAAIEVACAKEGISVSDIDLFEINEAFAAVSLVATRRLGVDPMKVNVNGGAIALGHPVGMSGARLVLHLVHELRRRGGGVGAAALCGGGGQGDAILVRVPGP